MNNLIEIGGIAIHRDKSGRYSLNDLHRAATAAGHDYKVCQVEHFMRNDSTQALVDELRKNGELEFDPCVSTAGRYGGTYACKELVYAYGMWISPKFNLQVIRTFDAVATGTAKPISKSAEALDAAKLFRPYFQIARIIGCDKQAAAISANQAVTKLTGTNMLALLGQTHIAADNQEALFFTPTELGERIGISGRKFNQLLAEAGFQMKRGEVWEVLEAGKDFARIYDTGKRHGSGVPIQQIKWGVTVLPLLKQAEEA